MEENYFEKECSEEEYRESGFLHQRLRGPREMEGRNMTDDNVNSIKMKISAFHGRSDPETYLEWKKKIKWVFDCNNYSDLKKVRLVVTEFLDYAVTWWDQLITSRRRCGERPIETWVEMKTVIKKRFVPSHYHRDLFRSLQNLK